MSLFEGIFYLHSFNRYLILWVLVVVVIKSLEGFIHHRNFEKKDNILSFILMIVSHLQLLTGIYLYLSSPLVLFQKKSMKIPTLRYWTVEHILMMVLAIILITCGRILVKRSLRKATTGRGKSYQGHRIQFIFNILALTFIILSLFSMLRVS